MNAEDELLEMKACEDLHSILRDVCSGILDGGNALILVVVFLVGKKCICAHSGPGYVICVQK